MGRGFHASSARKCFPSLGVPFALTFPWRTSGKLQIRRWKEGAGVTSGPSATARFPATPTYTPLLRSLRMVITTVYKLIWSPAGTGAGNKRRGVISADLSSARRAAAGSAAAAALIPSLAPFRSPGEFLPTDVTPEARENFNQGRRSCVGMAFYTPSPHPQVNRSK